MENEKGLRLVWGADDTLDLMTMMLSTMQKRNLYLEKNKWTLIAVTASFASHLLKKFASKSYATKQVMRKMRSLETR